MKKSSVAIITTVLIVTLSGVVYIGRSVLNKKNSGEGSNKSQSIMLSQNDEHKTDEFTFGEFAYKLTDNETIDARYMDSGQSLHIVSISPVSDKSKYDISPSGTSAVYLSKDSSIWVLFNDGTQKKITPDKYGSVDKTEILKKNPGFIWAEKPFYATEDTICFASDLPGDGNTLEKSVWEYSFQDNTLKKAYSLTSGDYKFLGYRSDGKTMILDGDIIAVIDSTGSAQTINVKDKDIMSLSTDGENIVYGEKNEMKGSTYKNLYFMNSEGKKSMRLPNISGYTATSMGAWNSDGSQYAFIIKSSSNSGDKVAVVNFDEGFASISSYSPEQNISFYDGSKIEWENDEDISVDTGNDVISVSLQ